MGGEGLVGLCCTKGTDAGPLVDLFDEVARDWVGEGVDHLLEHVLRLDELDRGGLFGADRSRARTTCSPARADARGVRLLQRPVRQLLGQPACSCQERKNDRCRVQNEEDRNPLGPVRPRSHEASSHTEKSADKWHERLTPPADEP
jgi:hypothetical protein